MLAGVGAQRDVFPGQYGIWANPRKQKLIFPKPPAELLPPSGAKSRQDGEGSGSSASERARCSTAISCYFLKVILNYNAFLRALLYS